MQLVQFQAMLLRQSNQGVCQATPFLGGILHGVFESIIRCHAPVLAQKIGLVSSAGSRVKHYRLLPPAYDAYHGFPSEDNDYPLEFGVILYHVTSEEANLVADLLCNYWKMIHFGRLFDKVLHVQAKILPIVLSHSSPYLDRGNIQLEWQSPLQLKKMHSSFHQPRLEAPSLLSIVRSIRQKALTAIPDAASTLGVHKDVRQQSSAWIDAEEAIRSIKSINPDLEKVSWQYGSRTKTKNIEFCGGIGKLAYRGNLPDPILTMLSWGTWLGVGEKPTFGQGMYLLSNITSPD